MIVYNLDTSIWLDYYEKRGKNGDHALSLMLKIFKENSTVIYSDLHIKELKNLGYSINEINSIFGIVKLDNLKRIHIIDFQKEEAERLAYQRKIPRGDALHAILARDNNATMVTRDKHFEKLSDIAETKKPENLL